MWSFIRLVPSHFFLFILIGRLSKWLLCSAVAVGETSLMMMTGSLKQAKHSALPRGLISCTNLPLIRLRLLSVHLVLFLLFSVLWSPRARLSETRFLFFHLSGSEKDTHVIFSFKSVWGHFMHVIPCIITSVSFKLRPILKQAYTHYYNSPFLKSCTSPEHY